MNAEKRKSSKILDPDSKVVFWGETVWPKPENRAGYKIKMGQEGNPDK